MQIHKIIFLFLVLAGVSSCKSEYTQIVEKERASGVVHNALFLDLKIGQTMEDFHRICWNLNKTGVLSQGPGNKYAKYVLLPDSTLYDGTHKVEVLFYGMFDRNKVMYGMDMKMEFVSWSPWNIDRHAPSLLDYMDKYYLREFGGNDFVNLDIDQTEARVKVDGNRQIVMYTVDNKQIVVKITDLRKEKYQF
jgi:hypothetical protein